MGYTMPRGVAQLREVKAEGDWRVVWHGVLLDPPLFG
jgi:hypothetical protein